MTDTLLFYANGTAYRRGGADVFQSLAMFLREHLRLTGTKVVCGEGACGACTVLVGVPRAGRLEYQALNSCLLPLYQIAGTHVVSVEGVAKPGALSSVQQAMVAHHGAQCGYCTPGMVMTLTGLCEARRPAAEAAEALRGNLCRCTGYLPILEAAQGIDRAAYQALGDLYAEGEIAGALGEHRQEALLCAGGGRSVCVPTTMAEAAAYKADYPEAVVVGGGTELGVQWCETGEVPAHILSLAWVAAQAQVTVADNMLALDAAATWSAVEQAAQESFPALARLLGQFGGPQIRNAGTVGGQVVRASAIGDALPLLCVMDAQVDVAQGGERRRVPIAEFLDAAQSPLRAGELVERVWLPLPAPDETLRLEKVSRRHGFDRSVVGAALRVTCAGGTVSAARLAFGGVAPTVCRAPHTEAFLIGKPLSEETLVAAGSILQGEISPTDDVRGGAEYRALLASNLLLRLLDTEQYP